MNALDIALPFVKRLEACSLEAYWDALGKVWTIGYGATGDGIVEGLKWTQEQADAALSTRLATMIPRIRQLADPVTLTEGQVAAFTSFAYNVGMSALANSSPLSYARMANWMAAAKAFLMWDKAGGQEVKGLLKRRMLEAALFLDHSP